MHQDVKIYIYDLLKNLFDSLSDLVVIALINNNDIGPHISFIHKNKLLENGNQLSPPYKIKVLIQDDHPINISGIGGYNLRFWIDDNQNQSTILDNDFVPLEPNDGLYNFGGYVELILDNNILKEDRHILKFQAWDILLESTI